MRVVGGRLRGRRIEAPAGPDIRPTADRVREAVFNILEHGGFGEGGLSVLQDARVLDTFAGTGAMGIEALSRGAAHVTFLDTDRRALETIKANLRRLGIEGDADVYSADCLSPHRARASCDLVFLDPPYGEGLAPRALAALAAAGWIGDGTLAVVETGAREDFEPPAGFDVLDTRRYGAAKIAILRRAGGE